jgi:TRAP transporter TAXI family solute receptor
VKLMTGPQGGSWYPLGGAIANIGDKAGIKVQVLPGAGIANVKAVEGGKADMGFGNSISTVDGVAGRAPFDAPAKNVCNVATLYPQYFQVVANADSGINSMADLKGKSIAVQPKGNTAEFISQQALQVYGLKYDDMGRVSYVSYTDAVSLMKDNNAQLFTLGTTVPASAIMDLASARDIKILGIPDDKFQAIRKLNPGYTKLVIPAGSYPKQAQDVQTIGYATHVIARCDLDADVVYKIIKGMVANKADLAAIAKAMAGTTPKMMAEDIGVPLHAGARRYYQEVGAL